MIPILASILVPLILFFGLRPYIEARYVKAKHHDGMLAIGCFVYFIAWYLPSPIIDNLNTGFWTHFAGGVATGCIWLYLTKSQVIKLKGAIWEAVLLFATVSSLGVLNELAEFVLVKLGIFPITLADTHWDLVANTLGALTFYIGYKLVTLVRK